MNVTQMDYHREYEATHVLVNHPPCEDDYAWLRDAWKQPMPILLDVGEYVWVAGSHEMLGHPEVKQIGDGRSKGFDRSGCCIISVPASWCRFLDEEEANSYELALEADEQLLRYAKG